MNKGLLCWLFSVLSFKTVQEEWMSTISTVHWKHKAEWLGHWVLGLSTNHDSHESTWWSRKCIVTCNKQPYRNTDFLYELTLMLDTHFISWRFHRPITDGHLVERKMHCVTGNKIHNAAFLHGPLLIHLKGFELQRFSCKLISVSAWVCFGCLHYKHPEKREEERRTCGLEKHPLPTKAFAVIKRVFIHKTSQNYLAVSLYQHIDFLPLHWNYKIFSGLTEFGYNELQRKW